MNKIKKENKRLILEIVLIFIIMLIVIPICIHANTVYNEAQKKAQQYKIAVDITNNNKTKTVTLNNYNKKKTNVDLVLKISKFSNEYIVKLDNNIYNLNAIEYTADDEFYYYNLGNYELDDVKSFDFQLIKVSNTNYDDNLRYNFIAKI